MHLIVWIFEHPIKQVISTKFTEFGISISSKLTQFSKANPSIIFRVDGNIIFLSPVKFLKALFFIISHPSLIVIIF